MRILYNLGIRIYYFLVLLASIGNEKAKKWIRGRRNWAKNLEGIFEDGDHVIWFHCASLGEFEQCRPILEKVKLGYPDYKILLTFFSPSGYEKRKDFSGADFVSYLPLDTAGNVNKLLNLVPIEKVFFIKYEFWYHMLKGLNMRSIPTYLASGNFRPDQVFFKWYGRWYRKFLHLFTHIFVQNSSSVDLLAGIGVQEVSVAGDTRFERVAKIASEAFPKQNLLSFSEDKPVIIAGSTWEKDEELLHGIYQKFSDRCKWIIAPHEPNEKNLNRLNGLFKNSVLFSKIKDGEEIKGDVILVDTIGHLSSLYQYGNIAYIGGGFGKGIHNILEAAAFGNPIFFGPNYHSFLEAKDLISARAAYVIKHAEEGYSQMDLLVLNKNQQKVIAEIAENYIIKQVGATDIIVDFVFIKGA
jgi:3-deoxy-D-manno-octulosonic-acid transferase